MTTSLKQLLAEQAALEQKISEVRATERSEAIAKIHELLEENALTQGDLFPSKSSTKAGKTKTKVAPKYLDPVTGNTWSGRGLAPKWLAGKNKEDYLIA